MFQGEYSINIDDKGRVNLPAAFRDVLRSRYGDERVVITRNPKSNALNGYPLREWQRLLAQLDMRPANDLVVVAFKRAVVSSAQEYAPDKQGRVLLPQLLRDYARLDKVVTYAGMGSTFEIWDKAIWNEQTQASLELLKHADLGF